MAYKTCENCGSRIFNLGCVSCNEEDYIGEQNMFEIEETERNEREVKREEQKRQNN